MMNENRNLSDAPIRRVLLANRGNPDFGQDPNNPVFGNPGDQWVIAKSNEDASRLCREYIEKWNLGGGNWFGGDVMEGHQHIGCISYNGRMWDGNMGPLVRAQTYGKEQQAFRLEPDLAPSDCAWLFHEPRGIANLAENPPTIQLSSGQLAALVEALLADPSSTRHPGSFVAEIAESVQRQCHNSGVLLSADAAGIQVAFASQREADDSIWHCAPPVRPQPPRPHQPKM